MKRTKIEFKEVSNDFIHIIKIENCATLIEIEDEFSKDIKDGYFNVKPNYYKSANSENIFIGEITILKHGMYVTKEEFNQIIATMKASGERLKKLNKTKSQTIEI